MNRLHRLSPEQLKTATLVVLLAIGATACKGSDDAPAGEAARNVVAEPTSTPIEASAHDPSRGMPTTSTIEVRATATTAPETAQPTKETKSASEGTKNSVFDSELYRSLTPEQQAEVKRLHDMPIEEFERLPADELFGYAGFVYEVYKDEAEADLKAQLEADKRNEYGAGLYTPPVPTNEKSTGQEVLNDYNFKMAVVSYIMHNQNGPKDPVEAEKALHYAILQDLGTPFEKEWGKIENKTDTYNYVPGFEPRLALEENDEHGVYLRKHIQVGTGNGIANYTFTLIKGTDKFVKPAQTWMLREITSAESS
jgi:hypothetical protein